MLKCVYVRLHSAKKTLELWYIKFLNLLANKLHTAVTKEYGHPDESSSLQNGKVWYPFCDEVSGVYMLKENGLKVPKKGSVYGAGIVILNGIGSISSFFILL